MTLFQDTSHRRFNPLTREWVLVSPHRTQRPWQGQIERAGAARRASLTILNVISAPATGARTATSTRDYPQTLVFDNDFPALRIDAGGGAVDRERPDRRRARARRLPRSICFSPRHDLTLARMSGGRDRAGGARSGPSSIANSARIEAINWVQIFENRGAMMGASNPHPHCQIWATESLPNEAAKELASQRAYRLERRGCLLCDYLALELDAGERVVCENEHFVALTPFWAVWPFETLRAAASAFRRDGRTERRGDARPRRHPARA